MSTEMERCAGDLNHFIGDSWLCDDQCNTCTCDPDGHVSAYGCLADQVAPVDHVEQTMVIVGSTVVRQPASIP
jgi:hypothetical protein